VHRSSGSSGWLKDLFLEKYAFYDAMVNYEAVIIETNRALVERGQEPLYVIYPQDGLSVADSPLGYVDQGDAAKEALFQKLQKYLLSEPVQQQIMQTGRRTGTVGLTMAKAAPEVFKPEWGINTGRTLVPIRVPEPAVVQKALELYQVAFRKPSLTVYCLDVSGSMEGNGIEQLKSAMRMLLDPATAKTNLLQAAPNDITAVIPFSNAPRSPWIVKGNDAAKLESLGARVNTLVAEGGTNIYTPTAQAITLVRQQPRWQDFSVAIVLMTDGQSNEGSLDEVQRNLQPAKGKTEIPVYGILFGDADEKQLRDIAALSSGKTFDGRRDLVKTFREVKGYN
jgi:Ca-activated chloride channel family protein